MTGLVQGAGRRGGGWWEGRRLPRTPSPGSAPSSHRTRRWVAVAVGVVTQAFFLLVHCSVCQFYGCAAVLVQCEPAVILSAAHCYHHLSPAARAELTVACGDHRLATQPGQVGCTHLSPGYPRVKASPVDGGEVRLAVAEVRTHPRYQARCQGDTQCRQAGRQSCRQ